MTLSKLFDKYGTDKGTSLHDLGGVYEPYFQSIRGTGIIEIGVLDGASLNAFAEYFGMRAKILGIDREDKSHLVLRENVVTEVASQSYIWQLRDCILKHFGIDSSVDMILDDASHMLDHQMTSLETLHHMLVKGGLYIVEDVHITGIGDILYNKPTSLTIETVYRYKIKSDWFTCIFRKN